MTTITIREQGTAAAGPVVSIDGQEYPFTLSDPFTEQEERRLEWYFEQHLSFPFTNQVRAREAAASITRYGHALFDQVFYDRKEGFLGNGYFSDVLRIYPLRRKMPFSKAVVTAAVRSLTPSLP